MATRRVLFDTSVVVELLERKPRALARLRVLADQGVRLGISMLTLAELLSGLAEGEQERTQRLLDLFDIVQVSEAIARRAAVLVAARRKVGRSWTMDDMLIAATAIEFNAELYTATKRDFEVPLLRFYTPAK